MKLNIHSYEFIKKLQLLPFVDEIWLFGSRARGDNTERADIDLAIVCPNATEKDWLDIMEIIENADTLLKIDCVRFEPSKMNQAFHDNILANRKVIYVKNKN